MTLLGGCGQHPRSRLEGSSSTGIPEASARFPWPSASAGWGIPRPRAGRRNPHACTQGAGLLRAEVEPPSEPQNSTPHDPPGREEHPAGQFVSFIPTRQGV